MTALSRDERLTRLDTMIAEGRIIRGCWTDGRTDGRERSCLLAALSPEARDARHVSGCPANVLPTWFARMTLCINDNVSSHAWPSIIRRHAAVVRRAAVLTDEDWRRLDYAARAAALRVTLPRAGESSDVVDRAIALCDRAARGETVSADEWAGARLAAAWAASTVVRATAWMTATAWTTATTWTASDAAYDAVKAVVGARLVGAEAAASAAWDTIANGVLDAIDAACAAREASS